MKHYCGGEQCPGLPWRASMRRHPLTCLAEWERPHYPGPADIDRAPGEFVTLDVMATELATMIEHDAALLGLEPVEFLAHVCVKVATPREP